MNLLSESQNALVWLGGAFLLAATLLSVSWIHQFAMLTYRRQRYFRLGGADPDCRGGNMIERAENSYRMLEKARRNARRTLQAALAFAVMGLLALIIDAMVP
jgi:hypothetical protein